MKIEFNLNPPTGVRGENPVMSNFRAEGFTELEIFIRECLQNVLDNRIDDTSEAIVKIHIQQIHDESSKEFIDNIFKPALPYISASQNNQLVEIDKYEALILEEFETRGITGTTNDSDGDGNWAKFWHAQAKSNKSGGLNGRAGQGKISYNMMSSVWTIFGLTNTNKNSSKKYLMGKCILPETFKLEGVPYQSQAFISEKEELEHGSQPIPFEDDESINAFCDAFSISRKNNELGTTWVIPFPKKNKKDEEIPKNVQIIQAVMKGYYYSILKQKLSVHVGETIINQESIIDLARKYLGKSEAIFFAFIKQIFDEETSLMYETVRLHPEWAKYDSLPEDFLDIKNSEILKNAYQSGRIVSIKLPITLHPKNGAKVSSYFNVYLKSDKTIKNTNEAFIRTDLVISGEKKLHRLPGNVFALIVADEPEIAAFLADSEIANHTKFNYKMLAVNLNYNKVEETLAVIRKGARLVYQSLSYKKAQTLEDLLNNYLSIKSRKGPSGKKKEKKEKKEIEHVEDETTLVDEVDDDIETSSKLFRIIDKAGSFEIYPGTKKFTKEELPARVKIETGYESVEGGSAFKKHHPLDYNFRDPDSLISVQLENLSRVKESDTANELQLDVEDVDFSAVISGFKTNSRLRVRITSY